MRISQTAGLFMVLGTTFLWGSWSQFVKKLDKWPVSAFMVWLFTFGFGVVSAAMLFLHKVLVPGGMFTLMRALPDKCLLVFICGMTYALGMQIQMTVVHKAGLIFSTSITAMLTIPVGCTISSIFGGIPENVSILQIVLGVVLLVAATLLCQKSTRMRDRDNGVKEEESEVRARLKYMLMLTACSVIFAPTYTIALSIGTAPVGDLMLPPALLVWILSGGALVGTLAASVILLARRGELAQLAAFRENRRNMGLALVAGIFHCGGNLIHTIASPVVSVAIAWPLGYLSNVWQYLWGMVRGEFKGAKAKTWGVLVSGILCFLLALVTLASALYW